LRQRRRRRAVGLALDVLGFLQMVGGGAAGLLGAGELAHQRAAAVLDLFRRLGDTLGLVLRLGLALAQRGDVALGIFGAVAPGLAFAGDRRQPALPLGHLAGEPVMEGARL